MFAQVGVWGERGPAFWFLGSRVSYCMAVHWGCVSSRSYRREGWQAYPSVVLLDGTALFFFQRSSEERLGLKL